MTSDTTSPPSTAFRAVGDLRLLTWPALDASGAGAAVTTRSGGVSSGCCATLNLSLSVGDDPASVLENRRRLAAGLGARPEDFVFARQVHGAGVAVVGEADRGRGAFSLDDAIGDADVLVTTTPGIVLAILAADCVPLVLHDPVAGVLACVHAGWRGTAAGAPAPAHPALPTTATASVTARPALAAVMPCSPACAGGADINERDNPIASRGAHRPPPVQMSVDGIYGTREIPSRCWCQGRCRCRGLP